MASADIISHVSDVAATGTVEMSMGLRPYEAYETSLTAAGLAPLMDG